ncbi:Antibiotic biosynthesis monooxygenase [Rhizoctonia solani]|uniref:Antibiotic biosynthesis monooxygenase n=1 Tax=Rhizoctonia solani TaxID=456999 RepID=A0A8H7IC78_9AGAM|nr:Antibiotic biosynthesis monooxygenase [Rhizoctonia solani]
MSTSFEHIRGKLSFMARQGTVKAQEDQGDNIAAILKAIQDYSTSEREPGCLTYRICRSGDDFFTFEEYANAAAVQEHFEIEGFKNLLKGVGTGTLTVGEPKITYYEEI